jgi:hypothetical protein
VAQQRCSPLHAAIKSRCTSQRPWQAENKDIHRTLPSDLPQYAPSDLRTCAQGAAHPDRPMQLQAARAWPPSKSHNKEQLTTRSRMAWKLLKFRASIGILTTQSRQTSWGKLHKQSALKHLPRPGDGSHCTWQHTVGMSCGYSGGMRRELRPTLVSLPMTRTASAAATVHRCNISKIVIAISHPDQWGFWEWLGQNTSVGVSPETFLLLLQKRRKASSNAQCKYS